MGVEFYIKGSTVEYPPCPTCGKESGYLYSADAKWEDCVTCFGYGGGDPVYSHPRLYLNNVTARAILNILGFEGEYLDGQFDADDLRERIQAARPSATLATRNGSDNQGIYIDENGVRACARCISGGLTEDDVLYRLDILQAMVESAGCRPIHFG